MEWLNGWTDNSTKNGKDVPYSKLIDWEGLIREDAHYAGLAYNYSTEEGVRERYIDKEIKQRQAKRNSLHAKYGACWEKCVRLDNGLVKAVLLDTNGHLITSKYMREEDFDIIGTEAAMSEIGKKGGSVKSAAKAAAVAENGKKGGRPKKEITNPTP